MIFKRRIKELNQYQFSGYKRDNHFTPDKEFKIEVMNLIRSGTSQKQAIIKVAKIRNVKLLNSYYKYPSSHVYRWKSKGINYH